MVADTAAGAAMAGGLVDAVLVGCDRVAANGDTANKIGTYTLAVLADANRIPFYVVGPLSSFDPEAADGAAIEIEQRPAAEVSTLAGAQLAPEAAGVWNPASTSPWPPSSPPSSPTPASSAPFRASIAGALAQMMWACSQRAAASAAGWPPSTCRLSPVSSLVVSWALTALTSRTSAGP